MKLIDRRTGDDTAAVAAIAVVVFDKPERLMKGQGLVKNTRRREGCSVRFPKFRRDAVIHEDDEYRVSSARTPRSAPSKLIDAHFTGERRESRFLREFLSREKSNFRLRDRLTMHKPREYRVRLLSVPTVRILALHTPTGNSATDGEAPTASSIQNARARAPLCRSMQKVNGS